MNNMSKFDKNESKKDKALASFFNKDCKNISKFNIDPIIKMDVIDEKNIKKINMDESYHKDLKTFRGNKKETNTLKKKRKRENKINTSNKDKEIEEIIQLSESDENESQSGRKDKFIRINDMKNKDSSMNEIEEEKENKLIKVESFEDYYKSKKAIFESNKNNKNFDYKSFCESIDIIDECNYNYCLMLLNNGQKSEFNDFYQIHQFTLNLNQRKRIQKKLNKNEPLMIINNYINEKCNSLREKLIELCKSIINISFIKRDYDIIINNLKSCFINHNFYTDRFFEYILPVKFGNNDLKICKLAMEILIFFFGLSIEKIDCISQEEKQIILEKLIEFKELDIFIKRCNLLKDEEFFDTFDYLINCYFIYFDSDKLYRKSDRLNLIIKCSLPFDLNVAKNFIKNFKLNIVKHEIDTNLPKNISFEYYFIYFNNFL